MPPYATTPSSQTLRRTIDVIVVGAALLCLWLIVLTKIGYGHVTFALPDGAQLQVNGHVVNAHTVKMRSGTYQIVVKTPMYQEYEGTLAVKDFQHQLFQPSLQPRSVNAIASSVVGAFGTYGPPDLGRVAWFDNDTWLAAIMGPGSAQGLVLHFVNGEWQMAYAQGSNGYPSDLAKLPGNVSTYMQKIEADYAGN